MGVKKGILACGLLLSFPVCAAEMDMSHDMAHDHVSPMLAKFMLDRFEARSSDAGTVTYWEAQAWAGSDINKLWLKTEGHMLKGSTEESDVELLYSRAVLPFWDAQVGVRHDSAVADKPGRDWAAFAMKGLAPYLFDVDATVYVGESGNTAARLKAEYNLLLSQRLVLMPEAEANLYGQTDAQRGLGSGLSSVDLALRLRYEIRREFAPYVGIVWTQKYGGTADYARLSNEAVSDTQFVIGVRAWW